MTRAKGQPRKNPYLACSFCHSAEEDDLQYGKMYTIKDITCHYFCVLLATKLVQRGKDSEGVFGFMYTDLQNDIQSNRRKKCDYCRLNGASIVCCHRSCRRAFHLPCGIRNGAQSLFFNTYQSFCKHHRTNQKIPPHVLESKTRPVVRLEKLPLNQCRNKTFLKELIQSTSNIPKYVFKHDVCYICYDSVIFGDFSHNVFWPPCCQANSLFHRDCLMRMAQSAGKHFLRCPLCNNSELFLKALMRFGVYIPDQDASWEREEGAYYELLERSKKCVAQQCCSRRKKSLPESSEWEMMYCVSCGSEGVHRKCLNDMDCPSFECSSCVEITQRFTTANADEPDEDVNVEDDEPLASLDETSETFTEPSSSNVMEDSNIAVHCIEVSFENEMPSSTKSCEDQDQKIEIEAIVNPDCSMNCIDELTANDEVEVEKSSTVPEEKYNSIKRYFKSLTTIDVNADDASTLQIKLGGKNEKKISKKKRAKLKNIQCNSIQKYLVKFKPKRRSNGRRKENFAKFFM